MTIAVGSWVQVSRGWRGVVAWLTADGWAGIVEPGPGPGRVHEARIEWLTVLR